MKILLFIPSLGGGGAERQLVNLAILFKNRGFDVEFLIYHEDYFYLNILNENNIKINFLKSHSKLDRIIKVRNFLRNNNQDVVISFLEITAFLSGISAIGGKKWKLITTELSSKERTFKTLKGKFYSFFRVYSDSIVCNSYNAMDKWMKYFPNYKDKLSVIYNPVILPEIVSEYVYRKNGKFNLVIAASYQFLKNPIGLIKAINLMSEQERNLLKVDWYGRIELIKGDTRAYDEAKELVKNLNLEQVIYLNKEVADIAEKFYQADAIGLFSELEGLPNSICEAMAIGKPIVMTKFSDYKNLVDGNGFLCDWDDPESIKTAILKLMNSDFNSIQNMGIKSKEKANLLFSTHEILNKWVSLFD
ncbi:glycosyltransferase [Acinetobacter towneri]|uniref:glycosyltransferase n=1 Tax=Acinetobacter towneri TaxID=202956 RepID=UPI0014449835|nr:glycosyltransferase [Acinetobacter towneri]